MARYRGPKHRLSRRIGYDIWGQSKGPASRRPYPPGQHGSKLAGAKGGATSRKLSNYGKHLLEKQKLRHYYGMLERQFRNTYDKATRMKGVKGDNFLSLLESRLDAVAYRAGFSRTIWGARQLAAHGHLLINGQKVDRPSCRVMPGDVVTIREKSRQVPLIKEAMERDSPNRIPPYLMVNRGAYEVRMVEAPKASDIPVQVDMALVVEFYSR